MHPLQRWQTVVRDPFTHCRWRRSADSWVRDHSLGPPADATTRPCRRCAVPGLSGGRFLPDERQHHGPAADARRAPHGCGARGQRNQAPSSNLSRRCRGSAPQRPCDRRSRFSKAVAGFPCARATGVDEPRAVQCRCDGQRGGRAGVAPTQVGARPIVRLRHRRLDSGAGTPARAQPSSPRRIDPRRIPDPAAWRGVQPPEAKPARLPAGGAG